MGLWPLSLPHPLQDNHCLKVTRKGVESFFLNVVLLTLEFIGICWDLSGPLDVQNADMTDNAEKERYPGHGNNADRQNDSKLRFILRYDQTLMTLRNVCFLMETIMEVWRQVWIPNLSGFGGLDSVTLFQTHFKEIWKHFLKLVWWVLVFFSFSLFLRVRHCHQNETRFFGGEPYS